jgi:phage baseplate assembly protein W
VATLEEVLGRDIAFAGDFIVSATGDIDLISGLENIKQALFDRLMTSPATLIHRPNYGVGIKDYQNAPATLATKRKLALRIQEQFEQDDRVEKVTAVSINFDAQDPSKTVIIVKVKVQGYDESPMNFIPFGGGV